MTGNVVILVQLNVNSTKGSNSVPLHVPHALLPARHHSLKMESVQGHWVYAVNVDLELIYQNKKYCKDTRRLYTLNSRDEVSCFTGNCRSWRLSDG